MLKQFKLYLQNTAYFDLDVVVVVINQEDCVFFKQILN